MIEAHPHIGTNGLPKRNYCQYEKLTILEHGGEIHFNTRVIDFLIDGHYLKGVKTKTVIEIFKADQVILATGHSARDIFELLHQKDIDIELKKIAVGVRVEHAQSLINSIQYKCDMRSEYLPPHHTVW